MSDIPGAPRFDDHDGQGRRPDSEGDSLGIFAALTIVLLLAAVCAVARWVVS